MFCKVHSADILGIDAFRVLVEADVSGGLPSFNMVGLPSSEVKEAKERVERAILNSGIDFPARRITINLSPAYIRKHGSGFDLPIAVAILAANGIINEDVLKNVMIIGELSLDGTINKVRGVLPIVLLARDSGFSNIIVPEGNAFEGAAVSGICVHGAKNLKELVRALNTRSLSDVVHIDLDRALSGAYEHDIPDFTDVKGQERAKRAALIAVAGFHNLLYIGPPGSGKSMLACRIPSILGRMSKEECLEVSRIYSVMGLLTGHSLVLDRPFRAPHQSISGPSLIGGMSHIKPGEITLAHKGVLFLDELTEFKRSVIEDLRLPLEERKVVLNRALERVEFPADFMLVAAANPCRCGYYPDRRRCRCTEADVERHLGKLKGPVLDRIDICVATSRVEVGELRPESRGMSSREMRQIAMRADRIQQDRYRESGIRYNSQMTKKEIDRYCRTDRKGQELLEKSYEKFRMTARGYYKMLKVARTIADMEGAEQIDSRHILEAAGYRNTFLNQ